MSLRDANPPAEEIERERREMLARSGRITDGTIMDTMVTEARNVMGVRSSRRSLGSHAEYHCLQLPNSRRNLRVRPGRNGAGRVRSRYPDRSSRPGSLSATESGEQHRGCRVVERTATEFFLTVRSSGFVTRIIEPGADYT